MDKMLQKFLIPQEKVCVKTKTMLTISIDALIGDLKITNSQNLSKTSICENLF